MISALASISLNPKDFFLLAIGCLWWILFITELTNCFVKALAAMPNAQNVRRLKTSASYVETPKAFITLKEWLIVFYFVFTSSTNNRFVWISAIFPAWLLIKRKKDISFTNMSQNRTLCFKNIICMDNICLLYRVPTEQTST